MYYETAAIQLGAQSEQSRDTASSTAYHAVLQILQNVSISLIHLITCYL